MRAVTDPSRWRSTRWEACCRRWTLVQWECEDRDPHRTSTWSYMRPSTGWWRVARGTRPSIATRIATVSVSSSQSTVNSYQQVDRQQASDPALSKHCGEHGQCEFCKSQLVRKQFRNARIKHTIRSDTINQSINQFICQLITFTK